MIDKDSTQNMHFITINHNSEIVIILTIHK